MNLLVLERVLAFVEQTPDAIAVEGSFASLTYA